jgi:hypothetical protein
MFDEVDIIGVELRLEVHGMQYATPAHPISFPQSFWAERGDLQGEPVRVFGRALPNGGGR